MIIIPTLPPVRTGPFSLRVWVCKFDYLIDSVVLVGIHDHDHDHIFMVIL